jgi:hypothetical protein
VPPVAEDDLAVAPAVQPPQGDLVEIVAFAALLCDDLWSRRGDAIVEPLLGRRGRAVQDDHGNITMTS